jgi:hypothetical protein
MLTLENEKWMTFPSKDMLLFHPEVLLEKVRGLNSGVEGHFSFTSHQRKVLGLKLGKGSGII